MKYSKAFTPFELTTLVLLRVLIGWHILYEGIAKLLAPNWSSASFLKNHNGYYPGFPNGSYPMTVCRRWIS